MTHNVIVGVPMGLSILDGAPRELTIEVRDAWDLLKLAEDLTIVARKLTSL